MKKNLQMMFRIMGRKGDETRRSKKKDKLKEHYQKNSGYSTKGVRIKLLLLEKNKEIKL